MVFNRVLIVDFMFSKETSYRPNSGALMANEALNFNAAIQQAQYIDVFICHIKR